MQSIWAKFFNNLREGYVMNSNKKIIVGLIILISFLYIVFNLNTLYVGANDTGVCIVAGTEACPHQEQLNFLGGAIPIIVSIALIVGAGTYYFMSGKVDNKQKDLKTNSKIILQFLNKDEKKLVNLLLENNGKILQAELTRLPGMTKVKSHRTILRLLDKEVIFKENLGKTNIIKLKKEVTANQFVV